MKRSVLVASLVLFGLSGTTALADMDPIKFESDYAKERAERPSKYRSSKRGHATKRQRNIPRDSNSAFSGGARIPRSCLPQPLQAILGTIQALFGPLSIISTHRPGAVIAGTNRRSHHAHCNAVDFVPKRNKQEVINYLKQNWNGGVGTYSGRMNHIHIDGGRRVRFHKHN